MPNLNARISRAEVATLPTGSGYMIAWLADGVYTVDEMTFTTLADVELEAKRRGVETTIVVEFVDAPTP